MQLTVHVFQAAMAKLIQPPQRFTHEDWKRSNLTKYSNAEVERIGAERLIEESKRLDEETVKRTEKTQRDVNKKLRESLIHGLILAYMKTRVFSPLE